jgi:hypothetical protein
VAAALAAAYRDFARAAEGRSPLYETLSDGVAGDEALLARIAELPPAKRQPNLLFAAMRYLFGVAPDGLSAWPDFRARALDQWDQVSAVMTTRRTQTNEPARCATLLPVLAGLKPPLALLEVGASAGLCLLPDYYAYAYGDHGVAPTIATARPPLFRCAAGPGTPLPKCNVEVVWRAGLDLNPLDVRDPDTVRWLKALVWPGEGEREELLGQALAIAASAPPRLVQGDLRHDLAALAAEAPKGATLVIFHSAVLNYIADPAERMAFAETVRSTGAQWVAQEDPDIFSNTNLRSWPAGIFFRLALNGQTLGRAESHGASVEWLA